MDARSESEFLPRMVSWNITGRCNLRCPHCFLDAGAPRENELETERCFSLVDEMASAGVEMLIISGGEPLLRRDLFEIARHASKKMVVVLGTNGLRVTEGVAEELKASGVVGVGISLDSRSPERHDAFRGLPGAWEGAVRGMRSCVSQRVPVVVNTTVLPMNLGELPGLVELAMNVGAFSSQFYFLVCTGRGEKLTDLTPEQYEGALASVLDLQARHPGHAIRVRCAPYVARLAYGRGSPLAGGGCGAGTGYCRVTPEGNVTPCPYLPLVAGNVKEKRFTEIWESEVFAVLRTQEFSGRCGPCEFKTFCGGCRARAFATTGDFMGEDPWCTYEPGGRPLARPEWRGDALRMLERVPGFVRERVKRGVEAYAASRGVATITPEVMAEVRRRGMKAPPGRPVP